MTSFSFQGYGSSPARRLSPTPRRTLDPRHDVESSRSRTIWFIRFPALARDHGRCCAHFPDGSQDDNEVCAPYSASMIGTCHSCSGANRRICESSSTCVHVPSVSIRLPGTRLRFWQAHRWLFRRPRFPSPAPCMSCRVGSSSRPKPLKAPPAESELGTLNRLVYDIRSALERGRGKALGSSRP
jgi:hypothetical protein